MTREKIVHTNEMVAHLWANQSQATARNPQGNFYFEGDTIYSYGRHFPIARLVKSKSKNVVLFTNQSYSVTTRGHINIVQNACYHLERIRVEHPLHALKDNLQAVENRFRAAMIEAAGARKGRSTEIRKAKAARILVERNVLAEFTGRKAKPMPEDFSGAVLKEVAREKARVKAENKKRQAERFDRLDRALKFYGCRDFAAFTTAWKVGQDTPPRWEYTELARISAERHGGEADPTWPCMLRVNPKNNEELETSLGVTVPLEHAHRIFKVWARVQGKVPPEGWTPKSQTESAIGSFKIDSIDADGTIHAGCHTIRATEVVDFAKRVGWGV